MSTDSTDSVGLGAILVQLQNSYLNVAQNKLTEAKAECMKAASAINSLLGDLNGNKLSDVKAIASFTLAWFEKLKKESSGALSVSDKLLWLSSTIYGSQWLPVIDFGKDMTSMDVLPYDCQEMEILMPESLSGLTVRFQRAQTVSGLEGFGDLCQDLLPNCSFVSSLLSIHDLGLGAALESLVKYNSESGCAKVKLYLNGCWRELKFSGELPFIDHPHSDRYMIVHSSTNEDLLWPALLEKAYLIASGEHYNFSGSNMAQDTHMLLGWPPEVRKITSMSLESFADIWELRKKGIVALGLGTGHMTQSLASKLKIVPGHDYVVTDFDGTAITLKNPWVTDSKERELRVDASVFGYFAYLYLNWNKDALYRYNVCLPVICLPPLSETILLDRPQLTIESGSPESQTVALSIEHFLSHDRGSSPFSVQVFENTAGKVVTASQFALAAGSKMTKSRVDFIKLALKPNCKYTVVITGPQKRDVFSARLWSPQPVEMNRAKNPLPNSITVEDTWIKGEGGNWGQEKYIDNPQWEVVAMRPLKVFVALSSDEATDLTFHLFYADKSSQLHKIRGFDKTKLVSDNEYSHKVKFGELKLPEPGHYRLVASNYDPEDATRFQLLLMHEGKKDDLEIEKIPRALGLFNKETSFSWKNRNRYKINFFASIKNTDLTIRLQQGTEPQTLSSYRPAIRASLFDGVTQKPVVINDKWNDCVYGVHVDCVLQNMNHKYILLVERFETGEGLCRLKIGSSSKVEVVGEDD